MSISLALPRRPSATEPSDEPAFSFTVPHVGEAAKPTGNAPSPPGWQGITAGWLAPADSAA